MRRFNITGTCVPKKHYMVDISGKLDQIVALIDNGDYFTINRARQYGKTTTFSRLAACLKERYCVIRLSFEGVDDGNFKSSDAFVRMFVRKVAADLEFHNVQEEIILDWRKVGAPQETDEEAFDRLSAGITRLCRQISRPVIVLIDEVDKSSDNQIFLTFLGVLRNKYLDALDERDVTFQSAILAGVYDIKNLKLKFRADVEKIYNSPWNIATDFKVDMSFSTAEIATMLESYEEDWRTGMDIQAVSGRIHFYTSGYPFLVSWICKWMDEDGDRKFTVQNVDLAARELLKSDNTLFDDLIKNIENNADLAQMTEQLLFDDATYPFAGSDPVINLGIRFGIFGARKGRLAISNVIFETYLYNHLIIRRMRERYRISVETNQFITDGRLDVKHILIKFQELMKAEYREEDGTFYEQQGRLLFLCFLKPIINGYGHYYVEPETRNNKRMDIVISYGGEEFIIELKIWHGEQYRTEGLKQLEEYLDSRSADYGYLVSFNFNRNKEYAAGEVSFGDSGRKAYEVII